MWTPEKIKRLGELSKEGLSSGAIADALGVTRNAALRKLYSTGLWVPGERRDKQKVPRARVTAKRPPAPPRPPKAPKPKPKAAPVPASAPEPLMLTIIEVRDRQCKYAVVTGQRGDHRFCGAPVQPGSPYCAFHHKACNDGPGGRL